MAARSAVALQVAVVHHEFPVVVHRHLLRAAQHLAHAAIAVVRRDVVGVVPGVALGRGVVVRGADPGARRVDHAGHAVLGDVAGPVVAAVGRRHARQAAVGPGAHRHRAAGAVADRALVVAEHEVEHHEVDLLHLAVEGRRIRRAQQALDAQHRRQHFRVGGAQGQDLVAARAQARVVADHRAVHGVADTQRLLAHAAGRRLVLDADRLLHHGEGCAFAGVQITRFVIRVQRLDVDVLHIAIGVGHAEGHMLGAAHQDARHAGQRRARWPGSRA